MSLRKSAASTYASVATPANPPAKPVLPAASAVAGLAAEKHHAQEARHPNAAAGREGETEKKREQGRNSLEGAEKMPDLVGGILMSFGGHD